MTEQTVAEQTDAGAKPAVEEAGGAPGDDLDKLLEEFDGKEDKTQSDTKTQITEKTSDIDEVVRYVRSKQEEEVQTQTRNDIATAVKSVQEQLDGAGVKTSDRIVKAMLNDLATEDPRFLRAFQNRRSNPKAWDQVLKGAARELQKEFEGPDTNVTEDREAVRAAVRSASTSAPKDEPLDGAKLGKMSDAEFQRFKQDLGG